MPGYVPNTTWENLPSTDTPITAAALNHIENGIKAAPVLINTDADTGRTIYAGSVDPSIGHTMVDGDIWIELPAT